MVGPSEGHTARGCWAPLPWGKDSCDCGLGRGVRAAWLVAAMAEPLPASSWAAAHTALRAWRLRTTLRVLRAELVAASAIVALVSVVTSCAASSSGLQRLLASWCCVELLFYALHRWRCVLEFECGHF